MYSQTTQDIEITVEPEFLADRSVPDQGSYFWAYTIEIFNRGTRTAQLVSRHWIILDANGRREEVRGAGVVGEQPILKPGESFRYTSGCPLATPSGIMSGSYRMVDEDGRSFDVVVPSFSLDSPHTPRVVN